MNEAANLTPAVLKTKEEIEKRVRELADQLSAEYAGRELLVVGILKGSWVFLADLVRMMTVPVIIDFMTVSSYGESTETSGVVKIMLDLKCPIENRQAGPPARGHQSRLRWLHNAGQVRRRVRGRLRRAVSQPAVYRIH
jgi:hypoxanthine-guanine phosphoribosyltransferase